MNYELFESEMRRFENETAGSLPEAPYLVARLDGRGFTRLTKERDDLEKPFDVRIRDIMVLTLRHLCECGFPVRYGFSQSDEISLLFGRNERPFKNSAAKWLSVLGGEASARFSLAMGELGVFDCRFSALPDLSRAVDYFRWRQSDGERNAIAAHCYWLLRRQNLSPRKATSQLDRLTTGEKRAFLVREGVSLESLPLWQRRGFGIFWEEYEKAAIDPRDGREVLAKRRRLKTDLELPEGEEYGEFLREQFAGL